MSDQLIIEAVKLFLQFTGALIVARLTVTWALRRFKSERTWDRRLTAYTDVVAAVSAMRVVAGQWLDEAQENRDVSKEYAERRIERYNSAEQKIEEAAATASIILGPAAANILQKLLADLAKAARQRDWHEHLDEQAHAIEMGLQALQIEAHRVLG